MAKRVKFNFAPFSKPRGGQNKQGSIWHSNPRYLAWQNRVKIAIANKLTPGDFQQESGCYVFAFYIKPKRGQQPDLDNTIGAIQDIVKKLGFIPDDNFTIVSNFVVLSTKVTTQSSFEIVLCKDIEEMFLAGQFIAKEIQNSQAVIK